MSREMHPVPSWQVFKYDMTSYYAFKGTSHRSGNGNKWSRVSNESLDRVRRCHTSIKKGGEEAVCNGLTVRWMDMSLLEMMRPPTEGPPFLSYSKKKAIEMRRKCDADRILWLFNWTEIDEAMLTQLPYRSEGGGSLASKKYTHVCFMF
jgi:hypothetical protein